MLINILPTREQRAAWRRDLLGPLWLHFAPRHFKEMARYLRNNDYDYDPVTGEIRFHGVMGWVGGITVNGQYARNTRTTQGTNHILDVGIRAQSQTATWYFAPFEGDVTPAITWTAANFDSNSTEEENYDEATRVAAAWSAAASSSITNSAASTFTASSGGMTVQGAGLLSVSTKASTSGVLLAAARITTAIDYPEASTADITYTVTIS